MTSKLLCGKNIILRAVEPEDIEILYQWENDTSVWKVSNTLVPFSRYQIREFVAHAHLDIYASRQLRLMINLMSKTEPDKTIGSIDLFDFEPTHARAGIGILICSPYRRKGYAAEALRIFLHYAKETLSLHQVYCNISEENQESIKLFEKAGFCRCGIKKDWNRFNDEFSAELMFQKILNNE